MTPFLARKTGRAGSAFLFTCHKGSRASHRGEPAQRISAGSAVWGWGGPKGGWGGLMAVRGPDLGNGCVSSIFSGFGCVSGFQRPRPKSLTNMGRKQFAQRPAGKSLGE